MRLLAEHLRTSLRGQAAVETALVLSIVMLLALATLDVGRGIAAHVALREATHQGAMAAGYRFCNLSPEPGEELSASQLQRLVRFSSSADAVTSAVVTPPVCGGASLTVRAEYPMPVITPLASFIFGPTIGIAVEVDATNQHHDP
jgi:TadE-like protein